MAFASISSSLGGECSLPAFREESSEHEACWWQTQTFKEDKIGEILKREGNSLHLVSGHELLGVMLSSLSSQLRGQRVRVLCSTPIEPCGSRAHLNMLMVSKSQTKHQCLPSLQTSATVCMGNFIYSQSLLCLYVIESIFLKALET